MFQLALLLKWPLEVEAQSRCFLTCHSDSRRVMKHK
ncbi:hypothetical protein DSM3645_02903 [Blastopirellula marina DSM 3645]|uniref:Uncharacterized protein n=1 Tax=Blastopirellula marina DSM 3645 TaxID=314230 RepID=A3ZVP4_9BACT|nr:hypothetical protein DSM3645_02903 [Blastopirellula marina DSM 3645]